MEQILLIPFAAISLFLCFLVTLWLADIGCTYMAWGLSTVQEDLRQVTERIMEGAARSAERRRLSRRFAASMGRGGAVDHDAVEGAAQMPMLRRLLDDELPSTIVRCIRIHRLSAAAVGARHIWEISMEPECLGLRYRMVGLAESIVEMLERYPYLLENEVLMANLITVRSRIVPTCAACPYLRYSLADAPLLCPTAVVARIDPARCRDDFVER